MGEIIDEAKQIAGIEKMNLYLTDEEMLKIDQEDYYKKGIQEGIEQTKRDMIINLYNNSVHVDVIAKAANLSQDEVKTIINKNGG